MRASRCGDRCLAGPSGASSLSWTLSRFRRPKSGCSCQDKSSDASPTSSRLERCCSQPLRQSWKNPGPSANGLNFMIRFCAFPTGCATAPRCGWMATSTDGRLAPEYASVSVSSGQLYFASPVSAGLLVGLSRAWGSQVGLWPPPARSFRTYCLCPLMQRVASCSRWSCVMARRLRLPPLTARCR